MGPLWKQRNTGEPEWLNSAVADVEEDRKSPIRKTKEDGGGAKIQRKRMVS